MTIRVCLTTNMRHYTNLGQAGGSAWLYLSWALGLRSLGCHVIWLEAVNPETSDTDIQDYLSTLRSNLQQYELSDDISLCSNTGKPLPWDNSGWYLPLEEAASESDLLLNIGYFPYPEVARFKRSALVDSDPGLTQFWISSGLLKLPPHSIYFTISETVGTLTARFSDCGIRWHFTPPPVFLPAWPRTNADPTAPFTTVSNWWSEDDYIEFEGQWLSNEKRTAFLEYLELPKRTAVPLELALTLGPMEGDQKEREVLEQSGWGVRPLSGLGWSPDDYRSYVQQSRGEFSCAKPFYVRLETSIMYDRTLHYLASGKPAIVQYTGPSQFLPDAEGLFRFRNMDEAIRYLGMAEADYERQSRSARALVEEYFDARIVIARLLERALA